MPETTTVLVPVRYPLTDASVRTLEEAARIAADEPDAQLLVLHVDPLQGNIRTRASDMYHAVAAHVGEVETEVLTRRGFFVEEVILEEAEANRADVVVVGADRTATWRRLLGRLLRNDPAVGSYLRAEADERTEIVEVEATAGGASADAADARSG